MKLILASKSDQRKRIFDMVGFKYDIVLSKEEEYSEQKDPAEYVKELSLQKAKSVAKQINEKAVIVAADSVIYMDGKIYEKPKNKEEAFNNIKEFSGKKNYAYTGVTIKDLYQGKEICFSDVCEVWFNDVSEDDIKWYVDNEKGILDKCGYAIFGKASLFLNKINGDINTLLGISPSKLYACLKELGYEMSDFS